ncbi:hypothetical protein ES702_06212 [subsurface metagenome]
MENPYELRKNKIKEIMAIIEKNVKGYDQMPLMFDCKHEIACNILDFLKK